MVIFVLYHNFNEISVLPNKIWGKSTDFILILSLYIFKVYSLGSLIKYSKQTPKSMRKIMSYTHGLPEFFGFLILRIIPHNNKS